MVILQLYRAGMTPAGDGEGAGAGPPEWIPVELEILTKLWLPDTEILRLKGFHRLSVLDRLQVRREGVKCCSKRVGLRLRELCRQGQVEVVSKSKNKILETWGPLFWRPQCQIKLFCYCISIQSPGACAP